MCGARFKSVALSRWAGGLLLTSFLVVASACNNTAPKQQKVDVGGHQLSLTCAGRGSSTVILENGTAAPLAAITWERVTPNIAGYSRVCYYDRAGYGDSGSGPKPRSSQQIVHELRALMHNAGISPPYILVGHSFGGLNVRLFANQFPDEVAGLVLVESAHEDMKARYTKVRQEQGLPDTAVFPPSHILKTAMQGYPWIATALDEWDALDESLSQVRKSRNGLREKPVIVLVRGDEGRLPGVPPEKMKPFDETWRELQREISRLSGNGQLIVVEGSGHDVPRDKPDAVVEAVRQVVQQSQ